MRDVFRNIYIYLNFYRVQTIMALNIYLEVRRESEEDYLVPYFSSSDNEIYLFGDTFSRIVIKI